MESTAKRIKVVNAACVGLLALLVSAAGYCEAIPGCMSSQLISLQACLPAVEGDNPPKPSEACCVAIRGTDTTCLCNIVTAYSNSVGVNYESAMLLPKLCKHAVPGGLTCDGAQSAIPYSCRRRLRLLRNLVCIIMFLGPVHTKVDRSRVNVSTFFFQSFTFLWNFIQFFLILNFYIGFIYSQEVEYCHHIDGWFVLLIGNIASNMRLYECTVSVVLVM